MKPEQENFDTLRRALALKRHEQPPPGYFDNFSRQVIARLKVAVVEGREPLMERLLREVPWVQRFLVSLEAKPAFAVAFGAAVCAVMITGVIFSESAQPIEASLIKAPIAAKESSLSFGSPANVGLPTQPQNTFLAASTNPVIATPLTGSLFDQVQPNVQPVSFQPHGN